MIALILLILFILNLFFVTFLINKSIDLIRILIECLILIYHTIAFIFFKKNSIKNNQLKEKKNIKINDSIKNVQHLNQLLSIIINQYQNLNSIGKRKIIQKLDNNNSEHQLILGEYEWLTYKDVFVQINCLIKVLYYKFNLRSGNRVVIISGFCQQELLITFFALQNLGIEIISIDKKLNDETIRKILNQLNGIKYVFIQSDLINKLDRFYMLNKCDINKQINLIIYDNSYYKNSIVEIKSKFKKFNFYDLIDYGIKFPQSQYYTNQKITGNQVAIILFTSDHTEGVVLTHSNLIECIKNYIDYIPFEFNNNDTVLVYLPMSHCFELIIELVFFTLGVKLAYARPSTLFNESKLLTQSKSDLEASNVTILPSVPLTVSRIKKQIELNLKNKSSLIRIFYILLFEFYKIWSKYGYNCELTDLLFFESIKKQLCSRLKHILVSGQLSIDTQIFIKLHLNVQLSLIYASTESLICSISTYDHTKHSNKMTLINEIKIRLKDWVEGGYSINDKPNSRGELIIGSKSICAKYFNNEKETNANFFEEDGLRWFLTGDIVEFDEENNQIEIIDSKKDLVKLQNGYCISLSKIEKIFQNCGYLNNIVLHANPYSNYLVAIVEANKDFIFKFANMLKKSENNLDVLCKDRQIKNSILIALEKIAELNDLTPNEIPSAIKLCTDDWESNSFIESSKPKRSKIYSFYKDSIDKMYLELDL